ncbi:hypothetical protein E8E15_001990 [Penicillium rubens]|nr:hypothetical protein E8E15_001990 [Penicillium rubens]
MSSIQPYMSTPLDTQNKSQTAMAQSVTLSCNATFNLNTFMIAYPRLPPTNLLALHLRSASHIADLLPLFDTYRKALFHFSLSLKEVPNQERPSKYSTYGSCVSSGSCFSISASCTHPRLTFFRTANHLTTTSTIHSSQPSKSSKSTTHPSQPPIQVNRPSKSTTQVNHPSQPPKSTTQSTTQSTIQVNHPSQPSKSTIQVNHPSQPSKSTIQVNHSAK